MNIQTPAPDHATGPNHSTVRLSDYRPFSHIIAAVHLTFDLHPSATRVTARLDMAPNPAAEAGHDLRLDGVDLRLISLHLDGTALDCAPDDAGLTIPARHLPNAPFTLQTVVEIAPDANTALEGLYMSNGMYCTQCEAQGFRKITFYPDRPDVMSRFGVRINSTLPVLLSNGNPAGAGLGWAEWVDPWPKPAYLFALVAGNLHAHRGAFTTMSGRNVALNIYVRAGDEGRCDWGMESLIQSMAWDERVYGREYDLDVFNIVAVDDFNMGAMENKGLNIFNSKVVLASPDTATDDDYARIEAIIAHEYFHNWTGNRITCRDWFQLCLKEGLTVFRDHQFSADLRGADMRRIEDVIALRARQFREDAGPLAHPPRPSEYIEINNFYTATVYEKGAEVIGMLKTLVGDDGYRAALDLYFSRHDGDAATIEDWLKVFEDATGRDLGQFSKWYFQAGTPQVTVAEDWDAGIGRFTLTFTQETAPTPNQPSKDPKVIPIRTGLLGPNGDVVVPSQVLEMTAAQQSFHFDGLAARPIPSILRGFSAPVVLHQNADAARNVFLLAHDTDAFNRWESARALGFASMAGMVTAGAVPSLGLLDGLASVVRDGALDPAFRALCLRLPSEDDLAAHLHGQGVVPDPDAIYLARKGLQNAIAQRLAGDLPMLLGEFAPSGAFAPQAVPAGRRALHGVLLGLSARLDGGVLAAQAFDAAGNMTDSIAALSALVNVGAGDAALMQFYTRWRGDRLVLDKWFTLQIALSGPDQTAALTHRLTQHPDFDMKNPNRFRAVMGGLTANHAGFHHASGAGYDVLADWLIRLDSVNAQTAARMSTSFEAWPRYDATRRFKASAALDRILAVQGLSRNLSEMVLRIRSAK
jgi:aminopeptidase N